MRGVIGACGSDAACCWIHVDVLDEDESQDVVERVLKYRDPRVLLLTEQRAQFLHARLGVHRHDVGAWCHHLAHHRLAEVHEGAEHGASLALLQRLRLPRCSRVRLRRLLANLAVVAGGLRPLAAAARGHAPQRAGDG